MFSRTACLLFYFISACSVYLRAEERWLDITAEAGLDHHPTSRVKFANLNNDPWPDIVIQPESGEGESPTIYLHSGTTDTVRYIRKTDTNLPSVYPGDTLVFADLDNDGNQDAILGRYLDIYQDNYQPPASPPDRSAWLPGRGDGSFGEPRIFADAQLATTRAIAVGDVNVDGLPDLYLGNWYEKYFTGYEAFSNDLLLQFRVKGAMPGFVRWPMPLETATTSFDTDLGGRPTYGAALPRLDDGIPMLLELSYGRRWNRLYQMKLREPLRIPPGSEAPAPLELRDNRAAGSDLVRRLQGKNIAAEVHVDGDAIRHGIHPNWPATHADESPRSKRPDEPPFRANGNTFDVGIGDIDNDGDFDLFLSTIIHAWAGESSDRSRFLVNQLKETGRLDFISPASLSVDRIPELPPAGEPLQAIHTQYNQGDIYAELADLNNDGRLDLLLCSSDYPDPPPYDERLRVYYQQEDGRFLDVTSRLGIDHVGAGMPSLGDIDGDGDLDLLIGQSFNRLKPEQRRAAALKTGVLNWDSDPEARPLPSVRLFRNDASEENHSLVIHLTGEPEHGVSRDAYGTIVRVTADLDANPATPTVTQMRQVLGPFGHSGKQHMFSLHFGLGKAMRADTIEIEWPNGDRQELQSVKSGRIEITQSTSL